jgi:hypothetical protein
MGIRKILKLTAGLSVIVFVLMATVFARLLRMTVPEPGGWFTAPGPDMTVVPWDGALGLAFLVATFGAAMIYAVLHSRHYYKNAIDRHLFEGQLAEAWRLAVEYCEFDALQLYLEKKVKMPRPELRESVLAAFGHLRRLASSAADIKNKALTPNLRLYARQHSQKGMKVLGETVERLVLLERQDIDPMKVRGRLDGIKQNIDHLAQATEAARIQLANLSLGPEHDEQAEEASISMRQVELVAEELHKYDNAMSARADIASSPSASGILRE